MLILLELSLIENTTDDVLKHHLEMAFSFSFKVLVNSCLSLLLFSHLKLCPQRGYSSEFYLGLLSNLFLLKLSFILRMPTVILMWITKIFFIEFLSGILDIPTCMCHQSECILSITFVTTTQYPPRKNQATPAPIVSLSVNGINFFPVTRTDRSGRREAINIRDYAVLWIHTFWHS